MVAASAQKEGDEMGKEEEGSGFFSSTLFSGVGMCHVVGMVLEITIRYWMSCTNDQRECILVALNDRMPVLTVDCAFFQHHHI